MVFFVNEFGLVELAGALDAPGDACAVVEEFGEGFGEAVGEGLHHESFVEVIFLAEFGRPFIGPVDRNDKAAYVVGMGRSGGVTVSVTVFGKWGEFPLGLVV